MARNDGLVTAAHGAGGSIMQDLIRKRFLSSFSRVKGRGKVEIGLTDMDDSGVVEGIVFTTDSHTVKPLFFPGGDIGSLSVAGTVNDLAVMGAEPLALSAAFVIEEGFPMSDLGKIAHSMLRSSRGARVPIITGDTKVVERGALDKMIINTSGVGRSSPYLRRNNKVTGRGCKKGNMWLTDSKLCDGDIIIVSGYMGDHGVAILSSREGYGFDIIVKSDVAPINGMMEQVLRTGGIVSAKDPTRGGLANTLNEWADKSHVGIIIREDDIPVRESVRSACELLGIDPLSIGNEGKVVLGVIPKKAEAILKTLKRTHEGKSSAIIGRATHSVKGVVLETSVGGKRILEQPAGDPVPRIC